MKSLNAIVVYLLASMSVGGVAAADPLLVNGSFESGLTGWTSTATVLNYSGPYPVDYSAFHVNAPDGLWYLFLGGRGRLCPGVHDLRLFLAEPAIHGATREPRCLASLAPHRVPVRDRVVSNSGNPTVHECTPRLRHGPFRYRDRKSTV